MSAMAMGMWLPFDFRDDEIHVQHDGAVWVVNSHLDPQQQFKTLAEAMDYANGLRDRQLGDRRKVILHRAASRFAT